MADAQSLSEKYSELLLPSTVIQIIAAIFGVFGNVLVLLMYTKYIEDKTGCRYFIPILAVVDLLGSLSNVIEFYLDNTMRYIYPGAFLCKTMPFLIIFTGGFSAFLILAIALQRYLVICRPFGKQMTPKMCRIAILLILLICIGYASPILKFKGISQKLKTLNVTGNVSFCHIDDGTNNSSAIITYHGTLLFLSLTNIVITSILYLPVIRTIYKILSPTRQKQPNRDPKENINLAVITLTKPQQQRVNDDTIYIPSTERSPEQTARRNISVMYLVIIVVYVVSYVTSLVTHIYQFAKTEEIKGYLRNIYVLCYRFNHLNHIANPYIYWFYDIQFRKELRKFCCSCIRRRQLNY
ncbi:orexin receptor type 2-like [Saccostrea cucullata]|uniref:orexin receptor type 2-like n=1 Tax=Saccostrea cuccullata TaxID=36930 RepID=UPI002ECFB124